MLSKMDGIFAPRPSTGPHKLRESLPLILILRNRLKYALTKAEANAICKQKFVKVDGKVRTDLNYPAGFMGKCVKGCWWCGDGVGLACGGCVLPCRSI